MSRRMVACETPSDSAASATVSCLSPGSRSSSAFHRWYLDTWALRHRSCSLRNHAQFRLLLAHRMRDSARTVLAHSPLFKVEGGADGRREEMLRDRRRPAW